MEESIEYNIRRNEDFRQALLKQDGGIMKYWAEHPDADGLDSLLKGYRAQCVHNFREKNKWSMSEDYIEKVALTKDHIQNELKYMEALKPIISTSFAKVAEQAFSFVEDYIDYAFREWRHSLNSDDIPPLDFYDRVIWEYDLFVGKAAICLKLVLEEHRGLVKSKKDEHDLWTEFEIRKYADIYFVGFNKLRQAVKEMIDKNTQNRTEEESRKKCLEIVMDTMRRLKPFARRVNGDYDLVKLPYGKADVNPYFTIWSTKDLELMNVDVSKVVKKDNIVITKEEMAWLQGGMLYIDPSLDTIDSKENTPLQKCFRRYYHILTNIGRIWAAQLLIQGIDMRELEKDTGCILNKDTSLLYYVDRGTENHRGDCCVYDMKEAKELLNKIKHGCDTLEKEGLMWTDRAKLYFQNAVTKGWMKFDNGKYSWCGVNQKPNGKPSKSELAYFLGKVYGFEYKDGNNCGAKLPAMELNKYFGFSKSVTDTLLQLYRRNNKQAYRSNIDDFFNELTQH